MELTLMNTLTTQSLLILLTTFIVTYLLFRRLRNGNSGNRRLPQMLPSLPIVGSLPFLPMGLKQVTNYFMAQGHKRGKIFALYAGSRLLVVINGREAIHVARIKMSTDFVDRGTTYMDGLANPRQKGIIFHPYNSDFKKHHQLGLAILKQFGYGNRMMETRILTEVEELVKILRGKQGQSLEPKKLFVSCVANVIMNILFGRRFDHDDVEFQQAIKSGQNFTEYTCMEVDFFPFLRYLPYYRKAARIAQENLYSTAKFVNKYIGLCSQQEGETKNSSFVTSYIESYGEDYDHEQLFFTLRDLIAAGTDTTATTLSWATLLLCNHQSVQRRLQAEMDSVVPSNLHRLPGLEDRPRLLYLEATIMEIMRIRTLVPIVGSATYNDTTVGDLFIPKNTMVIINLYSAHMDPAEWPQPEQFRPERFLDESNNVIDKERVIPFSLGKRSCFGELLARQEIFLFVAAVIQNFTILPPVGKERVLDEENWLTVNTPSDFEVRLVPRPESCIANDAE